MYTTWKCHSKWMIKFQQKQKRDETKDKIQIMLRLSMMHFNVRCRSFYFSFFIILWMLRSTYKVIDHFIVSLDSFRKFRIYFRSILVDKQLSLLCSWKRRNEFAIKKNTQSNGLCVHFALLIRNKAALTERMNVERASERTERWIFLVVQR